MTIKKNPYQTHPQGDGTFVLRTFKSYTTIAVISTVEGGFEVNGQVFPSVAEAARSAWTNRQI